MKKLTINYYLILILGLIIQAVFVVFSGNISIAASLETKALQAENQAITSRLYLLEDKISTYNSSYHLNSVADLSLYEPINKRITIASKNLASLP